MSKSARFSKARLLFSLRSPTLIVPSAPSPCPSSPFSLLVSGRKRFFSTGVARVKDDKEAWWKESMDRLRNIGISAHIDSGKTTLTERILFYTGRIHEIHEVRGRDGVGAKMDSMDLEREKGITIQSAATYCTWKDYQVNIIDTPGHVDFTIEVERALRVLDGAILVLCSVGGVQSQSITVDRQMRRYEVPRVAFINKLDRMGADPWKVLSQLRSKLRHHNAAVQVPIGLEENLEGLVDLVNLKAMYFHGSSGENIEIAEIPENMMTLVTEKRRELIEMVSEVDDKLAEAFLSDEPISSKDLAEAIRRATVARKFVPVFMGSAFKNKGVQPLLDGVLDYLPCPTEVNNYALDQTNNEEKVTLSGTPDGPLVALAFKLEEGRFGQLTYLRIYEGVIRKGDFIINVNTGKKIKVPRLVRMHSNEMEDIQEAHAGQIVAVFGVDCASGDTFTDGTVKYTMTSMNVPEPVMSLAVSPVAKDASGQFSKALNRFQKEDPTFHVGLDAESGQTIISGMGELHLEVYVERIRREYKVEATVGKPRVNFRETVTQRADFDYLHKKQSGGSGQYGRVTGLGLGATGGGAAAIASVSPRGIRSGGLGRMEEGEDVKKKKMEEGRKKRVESLGWLTESTILPKKHKVIEGVGASSILELKAHLYQSQQDLLVSKDSPASSHHHRAKKKISPRDTFSSKNSGVDARAHKDKLELKAVNDGSVSYAALERKAQLYDKLARGELSDEEEAEKYCVDFFSKSVMQERPKQRDDSTDNDVIEPALPFNSQFDRLGRTAGTMDREEHKRFVREVHDEARDAREKASQIKVQRQEQAASRREKLKQAFLKKKLENLKAASNQQSHDISSPARGGHIKFKRNE